MRDRSLAGRCARTAVAGLGVVAILFTLPALSHASFPGKNGKIAFTDYVGTYPDRQLEIFTINPDGSGRAQLTTNPASDSDPAWSPDGAKIAFRSTRDHPLGEIYTMNPDGSGLARLTTNELVDAQPSWSPDGTRIVFARRPCVANDPVCDYDVRRMWPDGSNVEYVVDGYDPAWAPDGSKIAFGRGFKIYQVNPDGLGETLFQSASWAPDWSPDSQRIVYLNNFCIDYPASCEGHGPTTFLQHLKRDGTDYGGTVATPYAGVFSPDGKKIAWIDGRSTSLSLMDPSASRSSWTALTHGTDPAWQPIPINSYPRPKGATPFKASLVPAYTQCTAPNRIHGPPLASDSCNPPAQASDELTFGSPDATGQPVRATGEVQYAALPGDVRITVGLNDVYDQQPLSDYSGELRVRTGLRITDKLNTPHPGGPGAATVSDTTLGATVTCTATSDSSTGSNCNLLTTANTLVPGTVTAGKRAVWELGQVQVDDGGADGDAETAGDNTLFMVQGVFVP